MGVVVWRMLVMVAVWRSAGLASVSAQCDKVIPECPSPTVIYDFHVKDAEAAACDKDGCENGITRKCTENPDYKPEWYHFNHDKKEYCCCATNSAGESVSEPKLPKCDKSYGVSYGGDVYGEFTSDKEAEDEACKDDKCNAGLTRKCTQVAGYTPFYFESKETRRYYCCAKLDCNKYCTATTIQKDKHYDMGQVVGKEQFGNGGSYKGVTRGKDGLYDVWCPQVKDVLSGKDPSWETSDKPDGPFCCCGAKEPAGPAKEQSLLRAAGVAESTGSGVLVLAGVGIVLVLALVLFVSVSRSGMATGAEAVELRGNENMKSSAYGAA